MEGQTLTREELICTIREALSADPQHIAHHAFIAELIEARRQRRERWEAIRRQVVGWALISLLSGAGLTAYQGYVWVRAHINPTPQPDSDQGHER